MKKIIVALLLVLLISPTIIASANVYQPGLLSTKSIPYTMSYGSNLYSPTLESMVDGNIDTSFRVTSSGSPARITFSEPQTFTGGVGFRWDGNFTTGFSSLIGEVRYFSGSTRVLTSSIFANKSNFLYGDTEYYISRLKDITRIEFVRTSTYDLYIHEIELYEAIDFEPPGEVSNLGYEATVDSVVLNYELPTDSDFSHLKIFRNENELASQYTNTSFTDNSLKEGTSYSYTIKTVDTSGNESDGTTVEVTTLVSPKASGEIRDLTTEATHERINLSWSLPQSEIFEHVNIYRGSESGESFSIMSAPVKIFETNGTYFNDLTVQPETTYNYRLTTYSTEGVESEGVTATVTTAEAPPPVIEGGSYTKDPLTGNFIYSWEQPTYGQVKILLGEDEFTTVDASQGQVSIPKNQMKYTAFGDPDVTLIAIDGDKTSEPIRPGVDGQASGDTIDQLKIPFTAQDLLGTGTGLLWLVAPFVLLALAFLVVPKLRNMLFTAISGKSNSDEQIKDGRSVREGRTYRESAPERNIRVPREKVERQERNMRMPRQLRGERG